MRCTSKGLDNQEAILRFVGLGRIELRVQEVGHIYLFPLLTAVLEVQVGQVLVEQGVVAKDLSKVVEKQEAKVGDWVAVKPVEEDWEVMVVPEVWLDSYKKKSIN